MSAPDSAATPAAASLELWLCVLCAGGLQRSEAPEKSMRLFRRRHEATPSRGSSRMLREQRDSGSLRRLPPVRRVFCLLLRSRWCESCDDSDEDSEPSEPVSDSSSSPSDSFSPEDASAADSPAVLAAAVAAVLFPKMRSIAKLRRCANLTLPRLFFVLESGRDK